MTGHDKLNELATALGISERTARRYLKAGVDLNDRASVEAHKHKIRSRAGVSKNYRRSLAEPASARLERRIEELEEVICGVHWLAVESPGPLAPEILERTAPIVERL
jgi:hypothetical protein